jgi:hypothetical protein
MEECQRKTRANREAGEKVNAAMCKACANNVEERCGLGICLVGFRLVVLVYLRESPELAGGAVAQEVTIEGILEFWTPV